MRLPIPKSGPARRLVVLGLANSILLHFFPQMVRSREWWMFYAATLIAAQSVVMAIWLAWGPSPVWKRWGIVLLLIGFSVYIELMLDWLGVLIPTYSGMSLVAVFMFAFLVPTLLAVLIPLRDLFGCQLRLDHCPIASRSKLSLRRLFVWILLVAVPLAFLRAMAGPEDQRLQLLLQACCIIPFVVIVAAICVFAVFARQRWYLWILVAVASIYLLAWAFESILCHGIRYFRDPDGAWPGYYDLRWSIRHAYLGFTASLLIQLIILRLIGVRIVLAAPRKADHSTTIAPQPSNVMPNVPASS
jgi:hypothetical protein